MGKKGKKGKKGPEGPQIVTTRAMLVERERCMCPRLGDAIERKERANAIKMECVQSRIRKVGEFSRDYLDMSASGLGFVPDGVVAPSLTRLVNINLSKNQLFSSDHVFQALEHIPGLKILNLASNFLNGPLTGRATDVTTLEELYLDNNQLTALPSDAGNWAHMTVLSVSKNELTELPSSCSQWKKIETLNLRSNKLATLPTNALKEWGSLKHFYLGMNMLTQVPFTIGKLVSLEMLDLRTNQLENLPPQLSSCTKLRLLNLGDNKITEVPSDILAKCVQLEELHLFRNKLEGLPDELGACTKLRNLTLSSNVAMKTLPDTLGACTALEELHLTKCKKFSAMPASAGDLVNLKQFTARECAGLKSLPVSLVGWTALQEMDVRCGKPLFKGKEKCKVPPDVFEPMEAREGCLIRGGILKKAKAKKGKK
jgi:hypothetical protein